MTKIKKSFCLIMSMFLIVCMLTGCVYEEEIITINTDGSGTIYAIVGISKEYLDEEDTDGEYLNSLEEEGFVLKELDGKLYYTYEEEEAFNNIFELNDMFDFEQEIDNGSNASYWMRFEKDNSGYPMVSIILSKTPENYTDEYGLPDNLGTYMDIEDSKEYQEMIDSMVMKLSIKFPTPMTITTGIQDDFVQIDKDTIMIDFMKANPDPDKNTLYVIQSTRSNPIDFQLPLRGFYDVDESFWGYDEIMEAVDTGLFRGVDMPDKTGMAHFEPNRDITRAEFITVIDRFLYLDIKHPTYVSGDKWYDSYVRMAIEEGIIEYNQFDDYTVPITREEMAMILANAVRSLGLDPEIVIGEEDIPDFNDISNEYKEGVQISYSLGLINGMNEEGEFSPHTHATRAQAATVIVRLGNKEVRIDDPVCNCGPDMNCIGGC